MHDLFHGVHTRVRQRSQSSFSLDDLRALDAMMRQYPICILFRDDLTAHSLAQTFEPYSYDYVEGYSMKRAGATHFLLLNVGHFMDHLPFAENARGD